MIILFVTVVFEIFVPRILTVQVLGDKNEQAKKPGLQNPDSFLIASNRFDVSLHVIYYTPGSINFSTGSLNQAAILIG
jgi:hypothetical protein